MNGSKYDADGNKVGSFSSIQVATSALSGWGDLWLGAGRRTENVEIKYNPKTGEFWGNGNKSSNNLFTTGTTAEGSTPVKVVIDQVYFCNAGGGCEATFDMDNFVLYEELPESGILESADETEKLLYYSKYLEESYVANGGSFKLLANNLKFTTDELPAGATLSWETDPKFIAADGTINRDAIDYVTTSITGTLKIGEKTITKTHSVKIAPYTVSAVSEYVNFDNYKLGSGDSINTANWSNNAANANTATNVYEGSNSVMKVVSNGTGGSTPTDDVRYTFKNVPAVTADTTYYVMEAKAKVNSLSYTSSGAIRFGLFLNNTSAGIFLSGTSNAGIVRGAKLTVNNHWHSPATDVSGSTNVSVPTNGWVDFKVKIDVKNNKVYYYENNVNTGVTTYGGENYDPKVSTINSAAFTYSSRTATSELYFDDIVLYTEISPDSAIASLDDAEKATYVAKYIEKTNIFNGQPRGSITKNLNLNTGLDYEKIGASVTWKSSDPTIVSDAGVILKRGKLPETVVMTATVTANDSIAEKGFKFNVAPSDTAVAMQGYYMPDFDNVYATDKFTIKAGDSALVDNGSYGKTLRLYDSKNQVSFEGAVQYLGDMKGRMMVGADIKYDLSEWKTTHPSGEAAIQYIIYGNGNNFECAFGVAGNYYVRVGDDLIWMEDSAGRELLKENVWHHIDIDYNFMGNSIDVYFDGVLLTEIPAKPQGIQTGSSPLRRITVKSNAPCELMVDNMYAVQYTANSDIVKVDAALKEAKRTFAVKTFGHPGDYRLIQTTPELRDAAVSGFTLPSEGSWSGKLVENGGAHSDGWDRFVGGAKITWTANGVPVSGVYELPSSPQTVKFVATATSGSVTDSIEFTNKMAPVCIDSLVYGTGTTVTGVKLRGAYSGKKLIISKTANGLINEVKMIDIDSVVDENGNVAFDAMSYSGATLHYYVVDIAEDKLLPVAFSK